MVFGIYPTLCLNLFIIKMLSLSIYYRFTRFRAVGMLLISGAKLVTNSNSQWLFAYCLRKQHYYLT